MVQGLLLLGAATLAAGPPYLTDDPEPVALHHWEVYLFSMRQSMAGVRSSLRPAMEVNYGPFQDAQFQTPVANTDQDRNSSRGTGQSASTTWNLGFEARVADHLQLVGSSGRMFHGGHGSQYYLGLRGSF